MPFWNKTDDDPTRSDASSSFDPAPTSDGSGDLLLGAGAEFEGKLTFAGTVRIDARFKGTIITNDVLVVGDRARIDADITCGTVIVHGEVNGNIRAKNAVELHAPARVKGDVETPSFSLERGVVFQGQSSMPAVEKGTAAARPASPAQRNGERQGAAAPSAQPVQGGETAVRD